MQDQRVALIVIDMQAGSFMDVRTAPDLDATVSRINRVAAAVRDAGGMVVFIQHDSPPGEDFEPGTAGWELLPELDRRDADPVIHKHACDAFYETQLEELLRGAGVSRLLISGSATDFCVDTTIRAAGSLNFEATVVQDGHLTRDREHLDAESIIEHHQYVWEELILPRSCIQVLPAATIIERLAAEATDVPGGAA